MKVFITGDRSLHPLMSGLVLLEVLRHVAAGDSIVTGANDGTEAVVRGLADEVGLSVEVVPNGPSLENGKPDWDARHANALDAFDVDRFTFIHSDPLHSSVGASLMRVANDEELRLVTPESVSI